MPMLHRRSFLERLSLGAGALLLSPMVRSLTAEAAGEVPRRKRVLFLVQGNGMNFEFCFAPPEFRPSAAVGPSDLVDTMRFTLPAMMAALAPHRDRLLLIDGLANDQGGATHSAGYAALSCVPGVTSAELSPPGGITIDQFIANGIGRDSVFKSIDLGISSNTKATLVSNVLAAGRGQPVPVQCSPQQAFNDIFGAALRTDAAGQAALATRRGVLDFLRQDINRVERSLVGRERQKMQQFISSIEATQARQAKLESSAGALAACSSAPAAETLASPTPEDKLRSHFDIVASAFMCGLTQVATVASGCGLRHFGNLVFRQLGLDATTHVIGHMSGAAGGALLDKIHNFHAELLAQLIARLQAVPEGDGTLWDNTVIVWTSDNGEQHHATHKRWPAVVVGTAGGTLRTQGRYLRYPLRGAPGQRSLADLFCSVAHAVGAPVDDFGAQGREPVKGPLPEIM